MDTMTNPLGIRCAMCKGYHPTVADVRACHEAAMEEGHADQQAEAAAEERYERWLEDGGSASAAIQADNERDRMMESAWGGFDFHDADGIDGFGTATCADMTPTEPAVEGATDRQWSYMESLATERGVTLAARSTYSKREASAEITRLKALPVVHANKAVLPSDTPDVAAGRYALRDAEDGTIKFYKVDRPTEGRWAGRMFVSVQASDDLHPLRQPAIRNSVLRRIAKDPKAAMLLYGTEIGSCGHCGRTLTNEDSRARGIGPVCADKMGW